MSNNLDPEQERLIRLREKQLSTRDPGIKKKKFTNMLSEKERRTKNSLSIRRVWSAIPHIWRWAFYGVVLGLITMAVLPTLWVHDKAWIVAIAAAVIIVIVCVVIGNALDTRDNIKDLSS